MRFVVQSISFARFWSQQDKCSLKQKINRVCDGCIGKSSMGKKRKIMLKNMFIFYPVLWMKSLWYHKIRFVLFFKNALNYQRMKSTIFKKLKKKWEWSPQRSSNWLSNDLFFFLHLPLLSNFLLWTVQRTLRIYFLVKKTTCQTQRIDFIFLLQNWAVFFLF